MSENKERKARNKLIRKCILFVLMIIVMLVLLDWMRLRMTAQSRYSDLNTCAYVTFLSAHSYREEGHSASEFSGGGTLSADASGFAGYLMTQSGQTNAVMQYGDCYEIVCDDAGRIKYVLYARGKIDKDYLTNPPMVGEGADKDRMMRLLQIPILWRTAVGVYYPAVISSAPAETTESN